jgi:hypothetical protein
MKTEIGTLRYYYLSAMRTCDALLSRTINTSLLCSYTGVCAVHYYVYYSVQPHPIDPVLATSGIESVVRLWAPIGEDTAAKRTTSTTAASSTNGVRASTEQRTDTLSEIVRENQSAMESSPFSLLNQPMMRHLMMQMAAATGVNLGPRGQRDDDTNDNQLECLQS